MQNTIQRNKQLWVVSFVTISVSSLLWPHLPSPYLLPAFVFIAWLATRNLLKIPFSRALILSGALIAIVWMASVGHWRVDWQLSKQDIRQIKQVSGSIETIISGQKEARFNLVVDSIDGKATRQQPRLRLSWKSPSWSLKQGQIVSLQVRVKPIHGLANEGGFHYQKWLLSQNIAGTGYVLNEEATLLKNTPSFRQRLIDKFNAFKLQHSAWIAAITFGDRSGLTQDDWQMIQSTGVAHLVAISGLHLGVVATLCFILCKTLLRVMSLYIRLSQKINFQHISLLITLFITLGYAYLAGFSLPTLRAWAMLFFWGVMLITGRYIRFAWFILFTVFIFLVLEPMSLLSASFWLSFGAIAFIGIVTWLWPVRAPANSDQSRFGRLIYTAMTAIRLQLMLCLFMMPIVAVYFSMISVSSPVVNLIAVPLVTVLIVPLSLLACILLLFCERLAAFVFSWVDSLLDVSLIGLRFFDQLSWSRIELPGIPTAIWACTFIALILFFMPLSRTLKVSGLLAVIPFMTYFLPSNSDTWKVHVLDVGQGLSVLIEHNDGALLYDTGAAYPSGFNMADAVILPLLKHKGISQLDWVFISHHDNDHAGSLPQLMAGVKVKSLISNQDMCNNDFSLHWHNLKIKGLWPQKGTSGAGNDFSCVLTISDGIQTILLPGDISKPIEKRLIENHRDLIDIDILIAAHHGSNTSSAGAFIRATSPQYAIFSQGYLNRWDFPRQPVVNRFVHENTTLMSTSESGQISFALSMAGKPIKVTSFRDEPSQSWFNRYLWH